LCFVGLKGIKGVARVSSQNAPDQAKTRPTKRIATSVAAHTFVILIFRTTDGKVFLFL